MVDWPSSSPSAGAAAQCARHPDRVATGTCERCGNFMCDECSAGRTSRHCPACLQLTGGVAGFPFSRTSWNFDSLWSYCWEAFKREWVMLSVGVLIVYAAGMLIGFISQFISAGIQAATQNAAAVIVVTVVAQLASTIVQGVAQLGFFRVIIDVLFGGKADLGRMGSQLSKAGRFLLALLLQFLIIGVPVGVIALIGALIASAGGGGRSEEAIFVGVGLAVLIIAVPLIYVSLGFAFVSQELVFNDEASAIDAIKASWTIAADHRLIILGVGILSGLVALVGLLVCCIGILPGVAMGQSLMTGLYLALRNGSGLPIPNPRS